jgi:hypothetical protein
MRLQEEYAGMQGATIWHQSMQEELAAVRRCMAAIFPKGDVSIMVPNKTAEDFSSVR